MNNITQLMYVDMPGDFLTLDGEQIYGFGPGLFFLFNGEALNLASEPPTYRNIPLKKLNPAYFWFLRGISAASLLVFLGVILLLPVVGIVAVFRRRRITDQVTPTQARNGIPGWLTGSLVWLASLFGVLAILGTAVLPMTLQGGALTVDKLWPQYPALIYGHLPVFNPVLPGYVQAWLLLPLVIFILACAAAVGVWHAWRAHRWNPTASILLTVVIGLLLLVAILIW